MDTIYSLFQKVVKEHENAPAIIENDRAMTFGELSNMVDMITCSFPQEVHSIGIVMRHRTEMIASILAVLKCGGRYVPAEPDFPTGRIHDMMTEAQVDFVLTEHAFAPKLSSFPIRYTDCEICGVETPSWKRNAIEDPERPAYVLYTSGTTGRPKGVCVTNRNVCHYVRAFANEFHPGPGDVMLQYSVCSFDIFVEEVFTSLLNGAALAIPADEDKADIHALMAFVERHHVTMISGFPYLLAEMNHLSVIPSSLRLLISGGDVLLPARFARRELDGDLSRRGTFQRFVDAHHVLRRNLADEVYFGGFGLFAAALSRSACRERQDRQQCDHIHSIDHVDWIYLRNR